MESSKININGFKFGIELETNLDTDNVEDYLDFDDGWHVHDEHCGSEIVSPILTGYKGLMSLRRHLRRIWDWRKAIKFNNCGLHVHVDIQHLTLGQAKRLLTIISEFDQTIFSMMDGTRWKNNYTRRCSYDREKIESIKTLYGLQSLQKNGERYSGTNLHSFSKHGTVEFRYATGSANWQKIYSLISMYLRIVAVAESDIVIPQITPLEGWTKDVRGFKYAMRSLLYLKENMDKFFNLLQISGGTKEVLTNMFEENVFDTDKNKTNAQKTEKLENVSFSLKEKSKK